MGFRTMSERLVVSMERSGISSFSEVDPGTPFSVMTVIWFEGDESINSGPCACVIPH